MLESLKQKVVSLLRKLPENQLVCATAGNISARDADSGLIVIKPSGVPYEELETDKMVVVDKNGNIIEGKLKPSSDTESHLYIYKNLKTINGIVHTHSPFATAFSAAEKSIPVLFAETAEEFGAEIPITEFVLIGNEEIGKQVLKYGSKTNAVILRKHGVFTMGVTPEKAVELAILTENSAHIAWLSITLGGTSPLSDSEIKKLYYRQQNIYGQ